MSDDAAEVQPGHQAKRSGVDLKALSATDLRQLIEDAQAALQSKQEAAKAELRAKWEKEAAAAGLTLASVLPIASGAAKDDRKGRKDTGSTLPVKFRGPAGEEWSGRGRLPKWIQIAEAEGRKRDDFLV